MYYRTLVFACQLMYTLYLNVYCSDVLYCSLHLLVICSNYPFSSSDDARDTIDLERSVLRPLAGTGNLFVYKMTTGFWSQVKNAG